MSRCTAVKKNGQPCRAPAVRLDLEGRCLFHSSLDFSAARRAGQEVTAEELIQALGREIRRLQRDGSLPPLARADSIKDLITLWREMTAPQPASLPKPLTLAEKIKEVEERQK